MQTELYRAADGAEARPGCHFAARRSDALAYTDNPGFGGASVWVYAPDMAAPLVLSQSSARDLAHLARVYAAIVGREAGECSQDWTDSGYDSVFCVIENAPGVLAALSARHDWISYLDDYPANAQAWRYLSGPPISGR